MSIHAVQYSLIKFLDDNITELNKVLWVTTDTTFTQSDLPLATVEEVYTVNRNLDKLFGYGAETHNFQIDLRATTSSELATLRDKIVKKLMGGLVPLYDTSQPFPPPVVGDLRVDVNLVNISLPSDTADIVNKHLANIDVSVFIISEL